MKVGSITIIADLRERLRDVRDQGERPTCVAHATSAAHEVARGEKTFLSPEFLHGVSDSKSGLVTFGAVSGALRAHGQPLESDWPYRSAPPRSAPPRDLRVFRRHSRGVPCDPSALTEMIVGGRAPILGLTLPRPFFRPPEDGIIDEAGPVLGRHAVLGVAVGRRGEHTFLLIRNSWGAAWGLAGHAWLGPTLLATHLCEVLELHGEVK